MILRRFAAAAALALAALFAAPAPAAFSNGQMNGFVEYLNGLEGLDAAQQKAVDQINATVAKEYAAFSKELVAYAKVVKIAQKAFPSDEGVQANIALLCDNESPPIDSVIFDLLYGSDGTGAAVVQLTNKLGAVKGALTAQKLIMKHVTRGNEQTDCSRAMKFFAKAARGAEKVFKKYGPLDT